MKNSIVPQKSFIKRTGIYLSERFPLTAYIPMIAVFTFSAAAYSRLARGENHFIDIQLYICGAFTALVMFFMLRVLDEHKDREIDRKYRPELPVPRGLVSLKELRILGVFLLLGVFLIHSLFYPVLLAPLFLATIWAALMTREFFVGRWLRAHLSIYLISHMMIMPMIDFYTTGLDWIMAGVHPGGALALFLLVTFLNGCVIEIGRKLRVPETERPGVDTYSSAWGRITATRVWIIILFLTALAAWAAGSYTGAGTGRLSVLFIMYALCSIPGWMFLYKPGVYWSRAVETAAGIWTLCMYLWLGAGPWFYQWFEALS